LNATRLLEEKKKRVPEEPGWGEKKGEAAERGEILWIRGQNGIPQKKGISCVWKRGPLPGSWEESKERVQRKGSSEEDACCRTCPNPIKGKGGFQSGKRGQEKKKIGPADGGRTPQFRDGKGSNRIVTKRKGATKIIRELLLSP